MDAAPSVPAPVVAVAAHAADMEFSAGLVLAKYAAAGHPVTIVHLTLGEKGHARLSAEGYGAQKRAEAAAAASALGCQARFLDYRDAELPADDAVKLGVADILRELRPRVLIAHWRGSIHRDHTRAHEITVEARFLAGLGRLDRPRPAVWVDHLLFAENWEDMEGYRPDVSVDVSDVFDTWLRACACYEIFRDPGAGGFRYRDYYVALATMRGCLARFPRACTLMRPDADLATRTAGLPG